MYNKKTEKIKNIFFKYKKHLITLTVFVLLLFVTQLFIFSLSEDKEYQDYFNSNYKVLGVNIPKNLTLAGEQVPVNKFNVREGIDRELIVNTYWQSQTLMMHKLANRWFPIIEPILKKNEIPDDFKYIALVESGLTNIVSPAGATGYWQLLESTAKAYGLEVNSELDERYNLEKSTEAACKYFKEAYKEFNSWTLVAASYNMGIAGIQRQLDKQKVTSYYDLLLNEETARYAYRIIAIKEILSHPKNYGYVLRKKDLYPPIPTDKITIDSSITDLAEFALSQGINYRILKYFNPWLRKNRLTNKDKKNYDINIPKKGLINYDIDECAEVCPPDTSTYVSTKEIGKEFVHKEVVHIVQKGETLASIAKQYKVEENMIKVWNMLNEGDELKPNQEIIIFIRQN